MKNDMNDEALEQEMQETRAALTEKLETLEQKVVGTVENAAATVTETVDAIKETVHNTVATVQEGVKDSVDSVKDFFDIPGQVQQRPWLMMGGSVAVGYVLGTLFAPTSNSQQTHAANNAAPHPRAEASPPAAPTQPSIWDSEISKLKGLALGVLFGTARELLVSSMPANLGEQVKDLVDSVTKKVGGEPVSKDEWAKPSEKSPPQRELGEKAPSRREHAPNGVL